MGKSLVIVESPAKARTINKYLGRDFVVKSSVGHIRDLPVSGSGKKVDPKARADPRPTPSTGSKIGSRVEGGQSSSGYNHAAMKAAQKISIGALLAVALLIGYLALRNRQPSHSWILACPDVPHPGPWSLEQWIE